jgi:hypothetical protein
MLGELLTSLDSLSVIIPYDNIEQPSVRRCQPKVDHVFCWKEIDNSGFVFFRESLNEASGVVRRNNSFCGGHYLLLTGSIYIVELEVEQSRTVGRGGKGADFVYAGEVEIRKAAK